MEVYGLLMVSVLTIALGLASLFQNARDDTVRFFVGTLVGTSLWAFGIAVFLSTSSSSVAIFAAALYYSAAALIGLATALMGLSVGRERILPWRKVLALSIPPAVITAILFCFPGILFQKVIIEPNVAHTIELASFPYIIYGIFFMTYLLIGVTGMLRQMHRVRHQRRAFMRLVYVTSAYSIAGVIGVWFNLILPGFGEYTYIWIGPLGLLAFLPVVYVAIIRYGLFDIRAAVLRAVTYGLVLVALAGIYYLVSYAISAFIIGKTSGGEVSMDRAHIILALLLAFLFQPFRRFFDKWTNRLFYGRQYKSQDFYEQLNTIVRSATATKGLMVRSTELIQDTLSAEYASFFVYEADGGLLVQGSGKFRKIPLESLQAFDELRAPGYVDDPTLPIAMRRLMARYKVAVAVPLYKNDTALGLLCLGERRVSHFSPRDLRVLRTAAGELVVGIQNTLAIQQIRDLNENLQRRVNAATKELRHTNAQLQRLDETKDEFMSMASHQLRTPLTGIKGYLSMLIDGDLGKMTEPQRKVLEEAFSSSERMVHLIGDFLNVSRLQTGKFVIDKRTTDFATLIESEVNALRQSASDRHLEIRYTKPVNIPLLTIDSDKFRQVVMNFLDNALYYSQNDGVIYVTLKKNAESIEFSVKDAGIGVPESEQEGLFGKFFRATNARRARPDGTGVGLFLAKKVVTDHKGEVIFTSKEGKGSTFGFRLPLPK